MKFIIFPVIFFGLALAFIWAGNREHELSDLLSKEGVNGMGTVVGKQVTNHYKKSDDYDLIINFTSASGSEVSKRRSVSRSLYNETPVGGQLPVLYVASDPTRFRLNGDTGGETVLKIFAGVLTTAGIGTVVYALFFRAKKTPVQLPEPASSI